MLIRTVLNVNEQEVTVVLSTRVLQGVEADLEVAVEAVGDIMEEAAHTVEGDSEEVAPIAEEVVSEGPAVDSEDPVEDSVEKVPQLEEAVQVVVDSTLKDLLLHQDMGAVAVVLVAVASLSIIKVPKIS